MIKIKTTEPKVLWKLRCKLGEGTLWVKEHNSIYFVDIKNCLLYTSPSPRDRTRSRMPSSA